MALKAVKYYLSEVVDHVEREHDRVVISKSTAGPRRGPQRHDLASLEEALDIARQSVLMKQIRASLTELAAGQARS